MKRHKRVKLPTSHRAYFFFFEVTNATFQNITIISWTPPNFASNLPTCHLAGTKLAVVVKETQIFLALGIERAFLAV